MSSGFSADPHSEQGYACPRNKFNLTDYLELEPIEKAFSLKRARQLEDLRVTGKFDVAHLKSIHRHLFQDVFPWAGEFRHVNISKGNSTFGPALHLSGALAETLGKLANENVLRGLEPRKFASRAAFYLGEINAIHPFREGNGRTQREFVRQLALAAGHPLSWAGFTQEEMVAASIQSHMRGDNSQLASLLERALEAGCDL